VEGLDRITRLIIPADGWRTRKNSEKPVTTAGLRDLKAGPHELEAGVTPCW